MEDSPAVLVSAEWFADELVARLGQVLQSMTGESFSARWNPSPASQTTESMTGLLWWEQALTWPEGAAISIGTSEVCWSAIGKRILEAAGLPPEEDSLKSTYLEILAQTISSTAQSLSSKLRRDLACGKGSTPAAPPAGDGMLIEARIIEGDSVSEPLHIFLNGTLLRGIDGRNESLKPVSARLMHAEPVELTAAPPVTRTMDLLMDVELPVSVSFGRTELPLKDVIKLTSGSIVELNRSITEPVEIIVNNCVIARGEVVVVEGNYGVRIDHVISRSERLRTLK